MSASSCAIAVGRSPFWLRGKSCGHFVHIVYGNHSRMLQ